MINSPSIAIIGAGPYGLSIAAYLGKLGVPYLIFGIPMHSWMTEMPKDMLLKSEGFASNLGDPAGRFTLRRFCEDSGLSYADEGFPVPRETLVRYGLAFQRRFVPQVEREHVTALEPNTEGFLVTPSNGEPVSVPAVVIAVGITHFRSMPEVLSRLPKGFVSHSAEHHELTRFRGRQVAIIGGGASAIDLAALLREAGAAVQLVIRGASLNIHAHREIPQPIVNAIRAPMSTIGPGWRHLFCAEMPGMFRYLPQDVRLRVVKKGIPPAAGWFMRGRVEGKVPVLLGHSLEGAEIKEGQVRLQLVDSEGCRSILSVDHVVAATGYRPDVHRLPFMSPRLTERLRLVENTPVLSANFETSIRGLHVVGLLSAYSFGPVVKFVAGSSYTARRVATHLARYRHPTSSYPTVAYPASKQAS
jgi:FAD-dependent urate hydroxylase